MKADKHSIVQVTWLDATRTSDSISKKDKPVKCFTVGYLLKRDDTCVVVASDYNSADKWRGGFVIPIDMVREVRVVE